jgi:hypothetical protein
MIKAVKSVAAKHNLNCTPAHRLLTAIKIGYGRRDKSCGSTHVTATTSTARFPLVDPFACAGLGMETNGSARGIAARQDAEAVVLDFVQPVGTARRGFGRRWRARFDKAGYSVFTL